ncbi:hypothetical protein Ssi03_53600 [Sphaerisporangium siamense]|uniref:Uncharacterized protein n=1 Tax=Sphaerisporangium siamense TaxID=795645 RepID=A0A7W7D6T7_9ACTN|nr:hypothetical protein [Sphaerisporangium siamense]MBB4701262.1 hypothetical protein [Sphaerisporangium siamense]GII87370.1 hypothetical protein Ssi03_53600 [Sphaerisporangium siamense]
MDQNETTGQVLGDEELEQLSGGQKVEVSMGLYIDPPGICVSV